MNKYKITNIPEEMQDATDFEIYVWCRTSATIGEIKSDWGKTTEEVKAAFELGFKRGWQYIPRERLPHVRYTPRLMVKENKPASETIKREDRKAMIVARNIAIYKDRASGMSRIELARKYFLSKRSVDAAITRGKKASVQ